MWLKAEKKCQSCGKTVDFHEMQIGHKTAYARGGATSMRNSVVLCYGCNKLQGTDHWGKFQKKMGKTSASSVARDGLKELPLAKLKALAKKHGVKVKGTTEETFFETITHPPLKDQYVKALSRVLAGKDVKKEVAALPAPAQKPKKRKRRETDWSWF